MNISLNISLSDIPAPILETADFSPGAWRLCLHVMPLCMYVYLNKFVTLNISCFIFAVLVLVLFSYVDLILFC